MKNELPLKIVFIKMNTNQIIGMAIYIPIIEGPKSKPAYFSRSMAMIVKAMNELTKMPAINPHFLKLLISTPWPII